MAILRQNPLDRELSTKRFSDLLDDFFNDAVATSNSFVPGIDIAETDTQFLIEAELPGLKKEDIDVSLENNQLTISGERSFKEENNGAKYHRVESKYGSFVRSIQLSENIESGSVSASYKNGILHITLDKSEEKARKQITIN